jgi:hypothetical protein
LVVVKCDSGQLLMAESGESPAKEAFVLLVRKLLKVLEASGEYVAPCSD